ncbi:MAG TPA: hypothetical protein VED40_23055 [Azospirillaceae bacterium]|nr:hypothetical protein [Azospirillaceae bacterium]
MPSERDMEVHQCHDPACGKFGCFGFARMAAGKQVEQIWACPDREHKAAAEAWWRKVNGITQG